VSARNRVVDAAMNRNDKILEFKIASWTQERKCAFNNLEVRLEAASKGTAVNIIKLVSENPRIFSIVDFKEAIGRDTRIKVSKVSSTLA
jgi:hypothetical protein